LMSFFSHSIWFCRSLTDGGFNIAGHRSKIEQLLPTTFHDDPNK
jgi:hypothetical protein